MKFSRPGRRRFSITRQHRSEILLIKHSARSKFSNVPRTATGTFSISFNAPKTPQLPNEFLIIAELTGSGTFLLFAVKFQPALASDSCGSGYPNMKGILFDLDHVVGQAKENLKAAGPSRPLQRH